MAIATNDIVTAPAPTEKVGFLRRLVAFIIDVVLLGIINQILTSAFYAGDAIAAAGINSLLNIAYLIGMWAFADGQTLGMKALGMKVVKTDGTPVTFLTALLRYVGLIISFFVLFLGVIWIAFDKDKQGWHDKIASTYVVRA